MNGSSWKKAADIVAKATPAIPQAPIAAMAESKSLQSLLLSALLVDESGPPRVTYEPQQSIARQVHQGQHLQNPLRYLQKHTVRYYLVQVPDYTPHW